MEDRFLQDYLAVAPIPLGLIRAIDCRHMAGAGLAGRILDAGCGDGLFSRVLFSGAPAAVDVGIDRDAGELRKALQTGMYKELIRCDIIDLPFAAGSFDLVFSNSVLEHIPDVDRALRELSRVLKVGGKLVLTVPSTYLSEQFFFVTFFRRLGLPGLAGRYATFKNRIWQHYHIDSIDVWEGRFRRNGLQVVALRYIHPQRVTAFCDIFSFSGALSMLWRRIFGRLLLFPSKTRGRIMARLLKRLYLAEGETGSTLFMVLQRKGP